MTPLKWNLAFFSAVIVFMLAITPLFYADDFSGGFDSFSGGFDSFGSGGFDSFGSGGFDSFSSGGFDSFGSGGFDSFGTGGFDSNGAGSSGALGTGSLGASSSGTSSGSDFNPFDDNFQPFDDIPGSLSGPDDFTPGPDNTFQPPVTPPPVPPIPPVTPPRNPPSDHRDVLGIFIENIFLDDPFEQSAGNIVPVRITFENDGNKDLEDTRVIVVIPDLAAYAAVGPFDLDVGETVTKTLLVELPDDSELDTYPLMIQIQPDVPNANDRIVYREIEIIDYS